MKEEEYYKSTSTEKIKEFGQFFTPNNIASFMAEWCGKSIKVYDVVFIGVDACASCSFTHFARGYGGRKVLLVA